MPGAPITIRAERLESDYTKRVLEVVIRIGLLILLSVFCFYILRPFLPIILWGIIIAVAVYPAHRRIQARLGNKGTLTAILITVILLSAVIVPAVLLTGTLVGGIQTITADIKNGTLAIPSAPTKLEKVPVVGVRIAEIWNMASTNLTAVLQRFSPQLRTLASEVLSTSAGIGLALIQVVFSIVVAGALLANTEGAARASHSLANRLLGERGLEFENLVGSTIRSVTTGIIGVALIQTLFASVGFLLVGLPGAGLWGMAFLVLAVLQVGTLLLIPAVLYVFVIASTTKAVLFLIWCVLVGIMDNFLKPILLGRGAAVPTLVVFLGAIGGFLAMGLIGLFVGAVVLSVGYKLLLAWLGMPVAVKEIEEH
jgi:predicted PurR-regulated permease PerM